MRLKNKIRTILRRLFAKPFHVDKRYPAFWFDKLLGKKEANIVQIGSNDGKKGDPLYTLLHKNTRWKAMLVEPVPYLFDQLKNNYSDSARFTLVNRAINKKLEKVTFYWVDPKAKESLPDLPYWYDQLGSFDRQHIEKHLDGVLIPYIRSSELDCIDLATLFEQNNITQIDILHIDTEGYDWNILSQLDLTKFQPTFILFEHNHLSNDELKASYSFLKDNYHMFKIGIDILAVKRKANEELIAKMTKSMNNFTVGV